MTPWPLALTLLGACVATLTDLRTRTIPNWLTLPLLAFALATHALERGVWGLSLALLGSLVCFLPVYFLFTRHALGGGDVKLFAAFGALVGPRDGLELELTAFVLVTLFVLVTSVWSGRLLRLLVASWRASLHLLRPARFPPPEAGAESVELPMGLAILCAVLALAARSVS